MDPILEISPNGTVTGAIYYLYQPSTPAAWTFVVLFAIAVIVHGVLIFLFRSLYFIPLVIGSIMETFAYYGRVMSSNDPDKFGSWIMQAILIMAAPPLIAATVYVTLARLIHHLDARENALMGARGAAWLFIFGDVVAFFSQIAGTGLQASTSQSAQYTGRKIVLAGLIFQLVLLSLFFINVLVFHRRLSRNPTPLSNHPQLPRWRHPVFALYLGSICILIRNTVRIAEYVQGPEGTVAANEVFVYLLDGSLIWILVAALAIVHPGRLFKKVRAFQKARRVGKTPSEQMSPLWS